jgi:CRISPR system Cascade subunit CasE
VAEGGGRMTALWLSRACLREDAGLAALTPVLLPEEANARVSMSHRLVWTLFGDTADRQRDFLWREDKPGQFMLLSARRPEPGLLFTLETKPFAPLLEPGDRLRFMLRVNPTVTRAQPGRLRGIRSDVVMDALKPLAKTERAAERAALISSAAADWLCERATDSGFALEAMTADGFEQMKVARATAADPKRPPIRFSVLDLEGVLAVTDPARFVAAVAAGFGRARAFGCGLMLIRRAP